METNDYSNLEKMQQKYIPSHVLPQIHEMGYQSTVINVRCMSSFQEDFGIAKNSLVWVESYCRKVEEQHRREKLPMTVIILPELLESHEAELVNSLQKIGFKQSTRILAPIKNKGIIDALFMDESKKRNKLPNLRDNTEYLQP